MTTILLDLHGFTRVHQLSEGHQAGDRITLPISLPLAGRGVLDDEVDLDAFESVTFTPTREVRAGVPVYRCVDCRLCGESRERRLIREVEARLAERIGNAIEVHRRLERKIAQHRARGKVVSWPPDASVVG